MTHAERLMQLETTCSTLATLVSEQGGTSRALEVVIVSLLPYLGKIPEITAAIEKRFEHIHADMLNAPNQAYLDGFEETKGMLLTMMKTPA